MTDRSLMADSNPPGPPVKPTSGAADGRGGEPPTRPSGLRNPQAAVRGVAAGALCVEAFVLLLAIVPLHVLGVRDAGVAIGCVVGLAVLCILLAGMLRRRWAWPAGFAPQVLLIACGYFHVALAVVGVLFLLVWAYVMNLRRTVLGAKG